MAARLWTSSLQRTELTAAHIPHPDVFPEELDAPAEYMEESGAVWRQMRHRVFRNLDEIYAGTFDGMTEQQIAAADSRFGADRKVDKLATRYPHGESYLDIMTRLEPIILELHSYQEPLLIVSHQATLRILLGDSSFLLPAASFSVRLLAKLGSEFCLTSSAFLPTDTRN